MIGPFFDSGCLFAGGLLGAFLSDFVPKRMKDSLPLIFGVITICLGTVLTAKVVSFPVVILSILLGASLGELIYAELGLTLFLKKIFKSIKSKKCVDEAHLVGLITLISAFCFGSMGIFGAINEGVTQNPDILVAKGILDFFTGIVFGSVFGAIVAFIAVPQFLILTAFYFCSFLIMPFMDDFTMANFTAAGGIIFVATGLRMCNIKVFPVINMVPALFLAIPVSYFWETCIPF